MKTLHFTRRGKPIQQLRDGSRFVREDLATRFFRHVTKHDGDGCWEWVGSRDANGYGKFTYAKGVYKRAHRVSWVIAGNDDLPSSVFLLHNCDNPSCVRPDHLRPGTQKDNIADMDARGRRPRSYPRPKARGELHHKATITTATALEIKRRLATGERCCDIARELGVRRGTVYNIKSGNCWRHL